MTDDQRDVQPPTAEEQAAAVEAQDLNEDGKVSIVEELRADLGVVDARLEAVADEGGVKGKIAKAAHQVVDKIDND